MTAADQPTTEPSGAVKHLVPPHSRTALCGVPMPEGTWTESPRFTRNPENRTCPACIAPAPQPAADNETEVQWGVRGMVAGQAVIEGPMSKFQAEGHLGERGASTFRTSAVVRRTATYTPWEEA